MSNTKPTGNGSAAVPETAQKEKWHIHILIPDEKVERIPLANLLISEHNTRHPKPADVAELALSMKEAGQTTPAIVRPHPKEKGKFEIAAGARRFVAAGVNGWEALSAVVRSLDDNSFEELLLVENLQREDPDPKAEVELIDRLIKRGIHTPEQISAHLGKSRNWAIRRVQLLKVIPELRKRWRVNGDLEHYSAEMMSLLGSLPEDTQKSLCSGNGYWLSNLDSRKHLQSFLDERIFARLDKAPFDLNDKRFFYKGCGPGCACDSSALSSLFQDDESSKEPPRCLRPECFQARAKMAAQVKMSEIKKQHGDLKIVTQGQAFSGNQEVAMFGSMIGVDQVNGYEGTFSDKEEKGAKKVLVWHPPTNSLKVKWLKRKEGSGMGQGGRAKAKPAGERLKERKAIKQGQRWLKVHEQLDKALAEAGHKQCTEDLVDLVAVFGMPFKASGYSDETFVKRFNARQKGYPLDSSASNLQPYERDAAHGLARPKGAVTRADALWHAIKIVLRSIMKPMGNVSQVPRKAYVMRFVAKLIKFPIEEKKREADLALPPSKSWGAVDIHTLEPLTKEQANKQFRERMDKSCEIANKIQAGYNRDIDNRLALSIECPTCHAKPGVNCKRPSGHRIFGGGQHDARINAKRKEIGAPSRETGYVLTCTREGRRHYSIGERADEGKWTKFIEKAHVFGSASDARAGKGKSKALILPLSRTKKASPSKAKPAKNKATK